MWRGVEYRRRLMYCQQKWFLNLGSYFATQWWRKRHWIIEGGHGSDVFLSTHTCSFSYERKISGLFSLLLGYSWKEWTYSQRWIPKLALFMLVIVFFNGSFWLWNHSIVRTRITSLRTKVHLHAPGIRKVVIVFK